MADCSHHPQISSSRDVDELLAELQRAQTLLGHVQALHHATPCEDLTSLMKEVGGVSQEAGALSSVTCPQKVPQAKPGPPLYPLAQELGGPAGLPQCRRARVGFRTEKCVSEKGQQAPAPPLPPLLPSLENDEDLSHPEPAI